MSKDQTTQPTLFQEDSPVNHSALQENEKEKMMTATSGMKLLELLPKQNQNGLLEKNVEGIINISNGTVLQQIQQDLEKEGFQVQCLVIPASGVGAWHQRKRDYRMQCFKLQLLIGPNNEQTQNVDIAVFQTPTATEIPMRSKEAMEKRKKYRESIGRKTVPHGNLLEQIQMMYPTPVSDNSLETMEAG
jgi:site-specific DNA-cytosine methylase